MENYISNDEMRPRDNISIYTYFCDIDEQLPNHDFIEIVYIFEGSGDLQLNDSIYKVGRGDIFLLNLRDNCFIYPACKLGIIRVLINIDFIINELVNTKNVLDMLVLILFNEFDRSYERQLPRLRADDSEMMELEGLAELMLQEFRQKQQGHETVLESYARALLIKIIRTARRGIEIEVYNKTKKIIPNVLSYIKENYNRKITLTELVRRSFYSPNYFLKKFKECYGKTAAEFIHNARIEAAIAYITDTDSTIESICYHIGFTDIKNFYELFKRATGITPEEYRNWRSLE